MAPPAVRTLLFDLGGVLIRLEPTKSGEAFAKAGAPDFMRLWRQDTPTQSLAKFERGELSVADFRREACAMLGVSLGDEAFDRCFCAMLGDIAPSTLVWLATLTKRFDCCMLSNNNALHLGHIEARYPSLRTLFRRAYFSQEIGCSKPHAAAFAHVLRDAALTPSATLFVDDGEANVATAKSLGLNALCLPQNGDVVAHVEAWLQHNARP